ncbi:hypothetical protein [Cryobacterium sp. Y11]|uniref:hypothetical protein n=1 Tax=Cryobacterium sp. Y11 TaxID=2045016 RepID=UPI000CE43F30|nr:hypothetical protein [Cryobacterium sp. Y11]
MDFKTATDADLDADRITIITEQERRATLVAIPAEVTRLAKQYREIGGDQAEIDAAIAPFRKTF